MIVKLKYTDTSTSSGFGFLDVAIARDEWQALPFETVGALGEKYALPVVDFRVENWREQPSATK